MPFPSWLLPLIETGGNIVGGVLSGNAQRGAIGQAGQINQQATNDAMNAILGLYDQGRSDLSPYRQVGVPALNNLQALANRGRPLPPRAMMPPQGNALANRAGMPFNGSGADVRNAINTGPGGQSVNVLGQTAKLGANNSLLGGLGGTAAGFGAGFAVPALGAIGGLGSGAIGAAFGPIGLGLGLLGSYIGSKFGQHNPSKAAASRGIDQVSRDIWGSNDPNIAPENRPLGSVVGDLTHGKITVAQAKQRANDLWNGWIQSMKDSGVDQWTIDNSTKSQWAYLQPLRDIFAKYDQMQPQQPQQQPNTQAGQGQFIG